MRNIAYFVLLMLVTSIVQLSSCKGEGQGKVTKTRSDSLREATLAYQRALTSQDTAEVSELCRTFLGHLSVGDVKAATSILYDVDSLGVPAKSGENTAAMIESRIKRLPVKSFKFEELRFFMPTDNTVTYRVAFNESDPPSTIVWGFCPIKTDDGWILTLR